jgi:hypothetical protein
MPGDYRIVQPDDVAGFGDANTRPLRYVKR